MAGGGWWQLASNPVLRLGCPRTLAKNSLTIDLTFSVLSSKQPAEARGQLRQEVRAEILSRFSPPSWFLTNVCLFSLSDSPGCDFPVTQPQSHYPGHLEGSPVLEALSSPAPPDLPSFLPSLLLRLFLSWPCFIETCPEICATLLFPCLFLRKPVCQPCTQLLSPPNSAPWLDFPRCRDTELCLNDCNGFPHGLSPTHTFLRTSHSLFNSPCFLLHHSSASITPSLADSAWLASPCPVLPRLPLQPYPSSSPSTVLAKLQPLPSNRHTEPVLFGFFWPCHAACGILVL